MNLSELQLNRYLGKTTPENVSDGSVAMAVNNNYMIGNQSTNSISPALGKDSKGVLTATVIANCIVQTSGGPDRVELSPYMTSRTGVPAVNSDFNNIESLTAYNGNSAEIIINKFGIFGIFSNLITLVIDTLLQLDGVLVYQGVFMPTAFAGSVKYDGTVHFLPGVPSFVGGTPVWSVTYLGTGKYRINHSIGDLFYSVTATYLLETGSPTGIVFIAVVNQTSTTFEINTFDISGFPADSSFMFNVNHYAV